MPYPSSFTGPKTILIKYSQKIEGIFGNKILYNLSDFGRWGMLYPSSFVFGFGGPYDCVYLSTRFVSPSVVTRQNTHCLISTITNIDALKEKDITLCRNWDRLVNVNIKSGRSVVPNKVDQQKDSIS